MKKIKIIAKKLWQDESGQGTAEYVLILVGVIALAGIFRKQIMEIIGAKMGDIKERMLNFGS